jgi:hypothetical protein
VPGRTRGCRRPDRWRSEVPARGDERLELGADQFVVLADQIDELVAEAIRSLGPAHRHRKPHLPGFGSVTLCQCVIWF